MSSALHDLADAAAEEAPQAPLPEPVVQQAVGEKRKRCGKVETAQKKVHKAQNDLSVAVARLELLQNLPGPMTTAHQKKLAAAKAKVEKVRAESERLEESLQDLQEKARREEEAAAARRQAAEERAEMAKTLTDLGSISMVQLRIKMQPRFDNSSDTSDAAWAHVHAAFLKLVEDGTLPEHDRISVAALKRRWTLEYGEFKMWCATANRAVEQSGVPRDQVEELVKAHYRCTTTTSTSVSGSMSERRPRTGGWLPRTERG